MSCNAPTNAGASRRELDPRTCGIYSRLETDEEFAKRVNGGPMMQTVRQPYSTRTEFVPVVGEQLDEAIWNIYRKQRRIVLVGP